MPRFLFLLDCGSAMKCSLACDGVSHELGDAEPLGEPQASDSMPSAGALDLVPVPPGVPGGPEQPSNLLLELHSADVREAKWEEPRLEGTWVDPRVPENVGDMLDLYGFGWLKKKLAMLAIRSVTNRVTIWKEGPKWMFEVVNISTKVHGFVPDGIEFKDKFGNDQEDGTGRAFWEGDSFVAEVSLSQFDCRTIRRLIDENRLAESITLTRKSDGERCVVSRVYDRA